MKAFLMYPDRDFDPARELIRIAEPFPRRDDAPFDPWAALPPEAHDLFADMQFDPILRAMAGEDGFLYEVARRAVLGAGHETAEVIHYRQAILRDVLSHPEPVRQIYDLAIEANETARKGLGWLGTHYASGMLGSAITVMEGYMAALDDLRSIAEANDLRLVSPGFRRFFRMLKDELSDAYFDEVAGHLDRLQFRHGVPMTAAVVAGAKPGGYMLLMPDGEERGWLARLFGPQEPGYTLTIAPRDEAGAQALSELRERGLAQVATALRRAVEHIRSFFDMIRTELAFYIGCLALDARLKALGIPRCLPEPDPVGGRSFACHGLRDLALALDRGEDVVGNDIDAGGAGLIVVTGANRGGKSTFLRSASQAQLMMQAGMIVGAEGFSADIARGVHSHFRRSEDREMVSGKLDEELVRMSAIVDRLEPDALMLFNESFAATNEREGSEIARQVTEALAERRVKMIHVTHLHSFAQGLTRAREGRAFLRADPAPDGTPSFRLHPGDPKPRSHGLDVFRRYFPDAA